MWPGEQLLEEHVRQRIMFGIQIIVVRYGACVIENRSLFVLLRIEYSIQSTNRAVMLYNCYERLYRSGKLQSMLVLQICAHFSGMHPS